MSLGGTIVRIKSVQADSYTLTNPAPDDYTGAAVVMRYDAAIMAYIAYTALIPILTMLGSTLYGPGVLGTSLRLDGLAQAKNMNPRGPFAAITEQFKELAAQARQAV